MITNQLKKSFIAGKVLLSHGRFNFARKLSEPTNPASITEMNVDIGDYAELERTFNANDLKLFSEAIQDQYAAHKQQ